ncbi:MAG: PEP-CTERM sorting domain-containing protein, partial [Opitutaceae bacterium]|nr:PEP-CTERM sorting domain-containing protein [Opitutaceae bacterium]
MVSPSVGGLGCSTQPPTMIRLFAELSGHYLFKIQPAGITVFGPSAADTALGLTPGTITSLLEPSGYSNYITNFGYAQITFSNLAAGTYSFAWAYAAGDYQPFNDGALFSIVGVNGTTGQSVLSLARTGLNASDQSGPSAGSLILGSYGSTDWNTTVFTVGTTGDYLVTFAAYNWEDTAGDPIFFLSTGEGSLMGTPAVTYGGAVPEPSTYAALLGVCALGFAAYRRRASRRNNAQ